MLNVVKTVVFSDGNVQEIAIASKHISPLMQFIAGIYISYAVARRNCGHIYIYTPSAPRELKHQQSVLF